MVACLWLCAGNTLCQLHLDAAVAAARVVTFSAVQRLKFTISGGGKPVCGQTLFRQEPDHRQRPLGRQVPVVGESAGTDRNIVRVAFHLEDPVDVVRNFCRDLVQRNGELCQLCLAFWSDIRLTLGKQHL